MGALERPAGMYATYLDVACGQDADLRQEVESLLELDRLAEGFLESYSRTTTATLPEETQIGAYQILSLLGAGGMGEVYRARNKKLGRDVALKTFAEGVRTEPGTVGAFSTRGADTGVAESFEHCCDLWN